MEIKKTMEEIENLLLDFNRGSEDLLKYSEVYFILDLIKRLVDKNKIIKELNKEIKKNG